MKFLVLGKPVYGLPPTPELLKAQVEALEVTTAILQDLKKKGKIESYYSFAGIAGGFIIADADSHEELNEQISTLPITGFTQIEVYPLITIESALETFKKAVAQLKK